MTRKKQKPPPSSVNDTEQPSAAAIRLARLAGIRGRVERQNTVRLPSKVMSGVSWCFHTGRARGMPEFVRQVTEYNDEIGETPWKPTELVIRAPLVRVAVDPDEQAKTIRSASLSGFTMADVLYQLHNHYYRELADADAAFFEGLELDDEGPPPFYILRLGS